jgi:hypothetical protein
LIKWNKKNTKNKDIIKKNKFTKKENRVYKKRIIVENFFSWKDIMIPRSDKIYDRKILNFMGLFLLLSAMLIIKKVRLNEKT